MIKNEQQRYWLAGILEGEGCFRASKGVSRGKTYQYPCVSIEMKDREIVEWVRDLIAPDREISVRKPRNNNGEMYTLTVLNDLAIDVMLVVYDLVGTRRKAAIDEALAAPVGRIAC